MGTSTLGTSTLGTGCQSYEYSVYGQTAASDPKFTANPYLFTGRRFDYETGLYYYRARYYNPYIGRFLQTDPVGYGAGMNLYAYCGNNPANRVDPSGLEWIGDTFHVKLAFYDGGDAGGSRRISGSGWREAADDSFFDVAIDMRLGEEWGYGQNGQPGVWGDLLDFVTMMVENPVNWASKTDYLLYLIENPGDYNNIEIDAVYIFDHGVEDIQGNVIGFEIGDEVLTSSGTRMTPFLQDFGAALNTYGSDAVIHFRGCKIGDPDTNGDRSLLKRLAAETGHTTTGIHGHITMRKNLLGMWLPQIGPDYTFEYGLYQATPGGTVSTVWKNELQLKRIGREWIWTNPWGPQPY